MLITELVAFFFSFFGFSLFEQLGETNRSELGCHLRHTFVCLLLFHFLVQLWVQMLQQHLGWNVANLKTSDDILIQLGCRLFLGAKLDWVGLFWCHIRVHELSNWFHVVGGKSALESSRECGPTCLKVQLLQLGSHSFDHQLWLLFVIFEMVSQVSILVSELLVFVGGKHEVMVENSVASNVLQCVLNSNAECIPSFLPLLVLLFKSSHLFDRSFCLGFH